MKKLLTIILACLIIVSLTACAAAEPISVNAEDTSGLANNVFGRSALKELGDGLWYDTSTGIVYWWNGSFGTDYATAPSPYYAPNGLPYKYNAHTNTFRMIVR